MTYAQTKTVYKSPFAYFEIIFGISSGKYFPIKILSSWNVLYLINVKILKNISNIATKNTVFESLLKKQITIISKTIKIIASKFTTSYSILILSKVNQFGNKKF